MLQMTRLFGLKIYIGISGGRFKANLRHALNDTEMVISNEQFTRQTTQTHREAHHATSADDITNHMVTCSYTTTGFSLWIYHELICCEDSRTTFPVVSICPHKTGITQLISSLYWRNAWGWYIESRWRIYASGNGGSGDICRWFRTKLLPEPKLECC